MLSLVLKVPHLKLGVALILHDSIFYSISTPIMSSPTPCNAMIHKEINNTQLLAFYACQPRYPDSLPPIIQAPKLRVHNRLVYNLSHINMDRLPILRMRLLHIAGYPCVVSRTVQIPCLQRLYTSSYPRLH
jgi:hypothetical protein